jgi:hypothetical protein
MKTLLPVFAFIVLSIPSHAQVSAATIKANFGVDADLRANYFALSNLTGNDDWFNNNNSTPGVAVIDTTGAATIYNNYILSVASRNTPVIRGMSYPPFSFVNNSLLMDAAFVRDYNGDDSTVFASGSNKNGMTPADWTTPVSQSVPDKNEILDVFVHVKREGRSVADSLWMFCGISIENTTGNRYFDFEMYQSDLSYNVTTHNFSGYGPDAGHTSWIFDASGNIVKAGDIILTSEYGSGGLTLIEARIWINKNSLSITPAAFSWSGQFDGANNGSQFGYASIVPNTTGPFYTGLQCGNLVWAGPFGLVLGDGTFTTVYHSRQFMEFAVNLSKLGLDPAKQSGGTTCDRPFQRVLAKTRASTSFTAELKDFVAPFKMFDAPKVDLFTDVPIFCGFLTTSNIKITNPINTSIYNWSTTNGHFADTSIKTSVYVDAPGTYIVSQKLNTDCPYFSYDTITIDFSLDCGILLNSNLAFSGRLENEYARLSWNALKEEHVAAYQIERSTDGIHFLQIKGLSQPSGARLSVTDNLQNVSASIVYYRVKIVNADGQHKYSNTVKIDLANGVIKSRINVAPNPVKDVVRLNVLSRSSGEMQILLFDNIGIMMRSLTVPVQKGANTINVSNLETWPNGIYSLKAIIGNEVLMKRVLISN